jgi:catechol 2,3-dioxygenase-like lactoylglutathione lyase family enzyme
MRRPAMPIRAIDHIDLAVADVERSREFYLRVLGPLGVEEAFRYQSYRGTEEIVYLSVGDSGQVLGLRQADGGEHRYYEVGLEHLALSVDSREEVEEASRRCIEAGARIHFPSEEDRDIPGYLELFFFDPDGFRIEIVHHDLDVLAEQGAEAIAGVEFARWAERRNEPPGGGSYR